MESDVERLQREKQSLVKDNIDVKNSNRSLSDESLTQSAERENRIEAINEEVKKLSENIEQARQIIYVEKAIGDSIAQEHVLLLNEVRELKSRIRELKELNSNLEDDNQKQDVVRDETHNQLDDIKNLLAEELKKRYELEEYVNNLKNQLLQMVDEEELNKVNLKPTIEVPLDAASIDGSVASDVQRPESLDETESRDMSEDAAKKIPDSPSDAEFQVKRMKIESQLSNLKQKLEMAKKGREMLQELSQKLEDEKEMLEAAPEEEQKHVPEWVLALNVDTKSHTIRHIMEQSADNPENMSFR
jgi:hypothetical protein